MDITDYKVSNFAFLFNSEINNEPDLLYSSLTGEIFKIHEDAKEQIRNFFKETIREIDDITFDFLKNNQILVHHKVDELTILKEKYNAARYSKEDLYATFVITDECNYRCHYCYQKHKKTKLTNDIIEKDLKLIEKKIPEYNNLKIHYFGGEPLLGLRQIEYISELALDISKKYNKHYYSSITTNGGLLNNELIKRLKQLKINQIQLTVDGFEADHNKLRISKTGAGTFSKSIDAIKLAIKHDFDVLVRINISPQNINNINNLLDYFLLQDITPQNSLVYLNEMKNVGYSENDANLYFQSLKDYSNAYIHGTKELIKRGFRFDFKPISLNCVFDKPSTLFFGTNGNLYHCTTGTDIPMADIDEKGEIINQTERMHWLYSKVPWTDEDCVNCKFLPLCMGGCSYLDESGKEKCSVVKYSVKQLVRLLALTN